MNSTGLDLSPTDIIKSEVIGQISTNEQQDYTDKWEDMEIQTSRQGFAELFSHIRMIYVKAKAKTSLLEEFRDNISNKREPKDLIDKILSPYAKSYTIIKECKYTSTDNANEINSLLGWLNKIDNSDWMPIAIKFLAVYSNDSAYVKWFLKKTERLAAYLQSTNKGINERIERYVKVLSEMENEKTSLTNPLKSIELTDKECKEFLEVLNGDIYYMTSKRRNYIILRLDSFVSDGGAEYSPKLLTIEHVMPQTINPSSKWSTDWPDLEVRGYCLNKIGNLVPLTRRKNSQAQNYDFDIKKEKYFKSSKGTSSYALTTQVLSEDCWTPSIVEKRQDNLLKVFKENWQLLLK